MVAFFDVFLGVVPGTACVGHEDGQYETCAQSADQQADHAASDDGGAAAGTHLAQIEAVQAARDGFRHRGLLERDGIRDAVQLRLRYDAVFGEAAVRRGPDSRHVLAEMADAAAAEIAFPAQLVRVDADAVARTESGHALARRLNHAGELMTGYRAGRAVRRARISLEDVDVRAAHTAGHHPHEDLAAPRTRDGPLLDAEVLLSVIHCAFHFCIRSF